MYIYLYAFAGTLRTEQVIEDAVGSDVFMCGMQLVGEDNPCHMVFQVDPEHTCVAPVEVHYYNSKKALITSEGFIRDLNMCAICANTSNDVEGGKIDDVLKTMYITVVRFSYT